MLEGFVEPPGNKRPSISDVAHQAGVSKAAVSKVIRNAYGVSPAMRARVEAAIKSLDYRPRLAARVMRGASYTIGVEVPHFNNDFFNQVIEGARMSLAGSSYQLIIAPGIDDSNDSSTLDALIDRQVDGIISVSSDVPPDWLENRAREVPILLLGRHDRSQNYDTITGDDCAGAEMVMDHLRNLGHERITHLTIRVPIDLAQARSPIAIRTEIYATRMEQAGLKTQVNYVDPSELAAYKVTHELLTNENAPTAIFAGYDTLAIGALRAIGTLGLTSQDVSVVGYDGIEMAGHPMISLTTVDQFGITVGSTAIEMLMERINSGRTTSKHHQIEPALRVRGSSRTAPGWRTTADPESAAAPVHRPVARRKHQHRKN